MPFFSTDDLRVCFSEEVPMGDGDVHIVTMRVFFALSDQNASICSSTFTSRVLEMLLSTESEPMEKTKTKKNSPHVPCPASQTLSMGRFFVCFLGGFATLSV